MAKKSVVLKKIKKELKPRERRLQTKLNKLDGQRLDNLMMRMGASSESEAIRRLLRFMDNLMVLSGTDFITLNVRDQKVVVPF